MTRQALLVIACTFLLSACTADRYELDFGGEIGDAKKLDPEYKSGISDLFAQVGIDPAQLDVRAQRASMESPYGDERVNAYSRAIIRVKGTALTAEQHGKLSAIAEEILQARTESTEVGITAVYPFSKSEAENTFGWPRKQSVVVMTTSSAGQVGMPSYCVIRARAGAPLPLDAHGMQVFGRIHDAALEAKLQEHRVGAMFHATKSAREQELPVYDQLLLDFGVIGEGSSSGTMAFSHTPGDDVDCARRIHAFGRPFSLRYGPGLDRLTRLERISAR